MQCRPRRTLSRMARIACACGAVRWRWRPWQRQPSWRVPSPVATPQAQHDLNGNRLCPRSKGGEYEVIRMMKDNCETSYDRAACPPSYLMIQPTNRDILVSRKKYANSENFLSGGPSSHVFSIPMLPEAGVAFGRPIPARDARWIAIWAPAPSPTSATANQ
jgi:hypothetical protein